jgi:hypothetical protein
MYGGQPFHTLTFEKIHCLKWPKTWKTQTKISSLKVKGGADERREKNIDL